MGRKATGAPTDFSIEVIDAVQEAITKSGMSNAEVIKRAKISQDYFYTRTRHEKPFNTNDVDKIAQVIGADPYDIFDAAAAKVDDNDIGVQPLVELTEKPTDIPEFRMAAKRSKRKRSGGGVDAEFAD